MHALYMLQNILVSDICGNGQKGKGRADENLKPKFASLNSLKHCDFYPSFIIRVSELQVQSNMPRSYCIYLLISYPSWLALTESNISFKIYLLIVSNKTCFSLSFFSYY